MSIIENHYTMLRERITGEVFRRRATVIHEDKFDYSQVPDYIPENGSMVTLKCKPCGRVFDQKVRSHLSGHGCIICHVKSRTYTTEKFIELAKIAHPGDKYDYSQTEYKHSSIKVDIKCNKCTRIFPQNPSSHIRGSGCPYCWKFKSENVCRAIFEYLLDMPFNKCRESFLEGLELDGYNPDSKIAFEYQGLQHYKVIPYWNNDQKTFDALLERDARKRQICTDNDITLLEIPYTYDHEDPERMCQFIEKLITDKTTHIPVRRGDLFDSILAWTKPAKKEVEKILYLCKFCGSILTNQFSLDYHQRTAKYCLEHQQAENDGVEYKEVAELTEEELYTRLVDAPKSISRVKLQERSRFFELSPSGQRGDIIDRLMTYLHSILTGEGWDHDLVDVPEDPIYNPDNLPRGVGGMYRNGAMVGFRARFGRNNKMYEKGFKNPKISLEENFWVAWNFRQALLREYNTTKTIEWHPKEVTIVRSKKCSRCGIKTSRTSTLCQSCSVSGVEAPTKEKLIADLKEHTGNLSAVGRLYGRTDATVRNWLMKYGFTREQIKTRNFESSE